MALKILPDSFARDPQRMRRFKREAEVLASLNHPNIAGIYGLESEDGTHAIVMELVEGETLAERIGRGPLPLEEALKIALQIAEALEAAHEKGIVHRDLKPANVKITPEGTVKVLDFGLAKEMEPPPVTDADLSQSPTHPKQATQAGMILGTAAYMSPEQARGRPVDKRTDIWAFGCVLYEMLTGQQLFTGESVSHVLASVLKTDPDWTLLPADTPSAILRLLRRCLERDRKERLQHVGDARIEIRDAQKPETIAQSPAASGGWRRGWLRLALVAIAASLAVGAAVWMLKPEEPHLPARFGLTLPSDTWSGRVSRPILAVSPDGRHIVYAANDQLHLRALDQFQSVPLAGTQRGFGPFFSPDGEWVGFFADGKLKKVSRTEGIVVTLCDAPLPQGGSWGPDGTIIFAPTRALGLSSVAATGGTPEIVTQRDQENDEGAHFWPEILPSGDAILFTIPDDSAGEARVEAQSLRTGEHKTVLWDGSGARYIRTGHLLYANDGDLFAVPFDPDRLEVTGTPKRVLEGVLYSRPDVLSHFGVSRNGTLAYLPGGSRAAPGRRMVWVDREGGVTPVTEDRYRFVQPRLSPDGTRVAVGRDGAIWTLDLSDQVWNRLTFGSPAWLSAWMPSGDALVFNSIREGPASNLFLKPDMGGERTQRLTTSEQINTPGNWSPDGRILVFMAVDPVNAREIWMLESGGDQPPKKLWSSPADETGPQLSPNGRWLAYASDQTGRTEIYVRPFPDVEEGLWQISSEGGMEPVWARDGRELFYRNRNQLMVVAVDTKSRDFSRRSPQELFRGRYEPGPVRTPNYDVSPDGKRFLMIEDSEGDEAPTELRVVLNWFAEFKRLAPTN